MDVDVAEASDVARLDDFELRLALRFELSFAAHSLSSQTSEGHLVDGSDADLVDGRDGHLDDEDMLLLELASSLSCCDSFSWELAKPGEEWLQRLFPGLQSPLVSRIV
mmetsp:Transcript_137825/g.239539  ORF Transcript_137825/g.239539 Transcript_137825/m.239539 type:complete len:108 (+) Transcript_137825:264-587(+)